MTGFSADKPPGYYGEARADLLAELPRPVGRVLDVGCGEGAAGPLLRSAGAEQLVGIEINADAAAQASQRYDEVRVGDALVEVSGLEGQFDTVLCYDVLEHLVDPGLVLRELRQRVAPGAHLHVSVPNGRHWSLIYDLVFRGTFGYTEWGHRDSTHLRWFTPRDLKEILEGAGWRVVALRPSLELYLHRRGLPAPPRLVARLGQFFAVQWFALARAA
jgi:2-polyprenyl-3-methyl-5-hydroxy-6-metoxy-1,4-benzoquinol methylase